MTRREEAIFERRVLARFGADPDVAIFKNEVGQGYYGAVGPVLRGALAPFGTEAQRVASEVLHRHRVTYGLHVGSSDLIAIVGPLGRLAAIELKSQLGVLRPEQRTFIERMRQLGAVAGDARSEAEVERLIDAARGGR